MSAIAVQPRIVTARSRVVVDGPSRSASAARSAPAPRGVAPGGRPAEPRPVATRPAGRRPVVPRSTSARPATRPAPLRLTGRGRAVVVLLGLLLVVAGVMGGRAVAEGPERGLEVVTHSVQAGETLWQIATGVAAPGEDVRDVVLRLQELNSMRDGSLTAGEVILLPAGS